jgi:hypothetical protein
MMTAFALWLGYNAIQMLDCAFVHFSERVWYCSGVSSGGISGSGMGVSILAVVVLILGVLWIWPLVRSR